MCVCVGVKYFPENHHHNEKKGNDAGEIIKNPFDVVQLTLQLLARH